MNYGEKISYLRKSKGMTQEELGKVFNVTYQAVSKWERQESLPDFNMMSQIAKFFQVPLSYFEEGGEDIEPAAPVETAPAGEVNNIIGMCTECGKMLTEEEIYTATPKIICRTCAARLQREEEERRQAEEEQRRTAEAQAKAIIEREESYRRGGFLYLYQPIYVGGMLFRQFSPAAVSRLSCRVSFSPSTSNPFSL